MYVCMLHMRNRNKHLYHKNARETIVSTKLLKTGRRVKHMISYLPGIIPMGCVVSIVCPFTMATQVYRPNVASVRLAIVSVSMPAMEPTELDVWCVVTPGGKVVF